MALCISIPGLIPTQTGMRRRNTTLGGIGITGGERNLTFSSRNLAAESTVLFRGIGQWRPGDEACKCEGGRRGRACQGFRPKGEIQRVECHGCVSVMLSSQPSRVQDWSGIARR
jgi:hypothetical protein